MHRRIPINPRLIACGGFPAGPPFCRCRLFRYRLFIRCTVCRSGIDLYRRIALCRRRLDLNRTVVTVGLACAVCALGTVGPLRTSGIGVGTVRIIARGLTISSRGAICTVSIVPVAAIAAAASTLRITVTLPVIRLGVRRLPLVPLLLINGIDAEVMFGMLIIVLRSNTVACGRCIARHSQVLFMYLKRVAANPDTWSVAVESLLTICAPTPTIPAARALRALALFHISLHIEAGFCFR